MENQFVTYELAVKLKELGFAFECVGYYYNQVPFSREWKLDNRIWDNPESDYLEAPLWQQAFDWFREQNKLDVIFCQDSFNKGLRGYKILSLDQSIILDSIHDQKYWVRHGCFKTFEEARLACLKQLINIIENE